MALNDLVLVRLSEPKPEFHISKEFEIIMSLREIDKAPIISKYTNVEKICASEVDFSTADLNWVLHLYQKIDSDKMSVLQSHKLASDAEKLLIFQLLTTAPDESWKFIQHI